MAPPMLIDSDVLVWLTRGHVGAATRLHALPTWRISAVTYSELAQGCRDKADLARLKKGLAARNTEIVKNVTRVSGPFVVEATLPATMDYVAEDSGNIGVTANKRIAVKVIDERRNELMVVKELI